jgi:nucleoid-associated protein YgaU
MNRQAVPSVLLSVSIVCFFAVALYQRDFDSGRSANGGGSRPSASRREPTQSARVGIAAADRAGVPAGGRSAAMARPAPILRPAPAPSAAVDPTAPPVPIPPSGTSRAVATDRVHAPGDPLRDGPARSSSLGAPLPAIRIVSDRSGPARPSRSLSHHVPPATARSSGVKLARAPFTIVGSGETLSDVARRIYGTGDEAEWLWRANRDLVGEPGATVPPGTVLRTPARPGR